MKEIIVIPSAVIEVIDATLEDFSDKGHLYNAIVRYALYRESPELDGFLKTLFDLMKVSIQLANPKKR